MLSLPSLPLCSAWGSHFPPHSLPVPTLGQSLALGALLISFQLFEWVQHRMLLVCVNSASVVSVDITAVQRCPWFRLCQQCFPVNLIFLQAHGF